VAAIKQSEEVGPPGARIPGISARAGRSDARTAPGSKGSAAPGSDRAGAPPARYDLPVNGPSPWVARRFEFSSSPADYTALLGRLESAPARLAALTQGLPPATLTDRAGPGPGGRWSIQQHAGHLLDLEPLMDRRLSEFLEGVPVLTPADMTNRATEEADHDRVPWAELLDRFRAARAALVARIRALRPEDLERAALHLRLGVPMRVLDWMEFTAEHDDHHLAIIAARVARG